MRRILSVLLAACLLSPVPRLLSADAPAPVLADPTTGTLFRPSAATLAASNDFTPAVSAATTSLAGKVELATNAETATGTSSTLAIVPAGLAHARPLGQGFDDISGFQYWDHRGLPNVYPEETLEAYRASVEAGAQFIEFDCHVLNDGAVAVMHDDTIDRTTSSSGDVADYDSVTWTRLVVDASSFLGGGWSDTRPPFANELLREYGNRVPILVEAKSSGSGPSVLAAVQKYGVAKSHVIINSFTASDLTAAIAAGYTTCLNVSVYAGSPSPAALVATGYNWIAVEYGTSTAQMDSLRSAGLKVAVYTVNSAKQITGFSSNADAVYTNEGVYLRGNARLTSDPWGRQTWYHGHVAANASGDGSGRGAFYTADYWGYDMDAANTWVGALQGWASPMGGSPTFSGTITITFTVKFESAFGADRFAWVAISESDEPMASDLPTGGDHRGYAFLCRKNGAVEIYTFDTGENLTPLVATAGTTISDGASANYTITVTPTDVTLERTDVTTTVTSSNSALGRGAYLHAGVKGVFGKFKDMTITGP